MKTKIGTKSKAKKITIIVCSVLLFLILIVIPFSLSIMIYESNFSGRYEKTSWMVRSIEEFDGLNAERHTFASDNGTELVGYTYTKGSNDKKGVIVIAHGLGGGGHNSYMDIADYFATNGYVVFGYDATGNDESGGASVKGIPQGVIDLEHAISYVQQSSDFKGMPVMLFGHSWGAYSSGSVLNVHPEVKAVVMVSGFNKSIDIIEEEGKRIMGDTMSLLTPYVSVVEWVKFGPYSAYTCEEGFDKSEADIMIIHSEDDSMVSFENQYQRFYDKYNSNSRFNFISYKDRGHDYVYYSDTTKQYRDELNADFKTYIDSLGTELTAEIKAKYMNENLDKAQLFDLDEEVMEKIISFYNSSLN